MINSKYIYVENNEVYTSLNASVWAKYQDLDKTIISIDYFKNQFYVILADGLYVSNDLEVFSLLDGNYKQGYLFHDDSNLYIVNGTTIVNYTEDTTVTININASSIEYIQTYYYATVGNLIYRSKDLITFYLVKTNFDADMSNLRLLSDMNRVIIFYNDSNNALYSRECTNTANLAYWNDAQNVDNTLNSLINGKFMYNDQAYTETPIYTEDRTFDDRVKVKANGQSNVEVITSIVPASFEVEWEKNSTYQIEFTAYDDGSLAFEMISTEAEIIFNGQSFIVKDCEPDYTGGVATVEVTATHIYNEISRIRQYSTKSGTLTYTVQDVLSFYLDNNSDNSLGFTYKVYGDFSKETITDLGNNSGSDMLSQILSTWSTAIIFPDNKCIGVYTPDAFTKSFGGRIDYANNASEIKMTIDSTSIVNRVKCIGAEKDTTDDDSDTDNSTVEYYFDPFFVQDDSSVSTWGIHLGDDVSDERFTDAANMKTYALTQLTPEPSISIDVTYSGNEMPIAGEQKRIEIKSANFVTFVTVIGYTWYPLDTTQTTDLEFENLTATILNSQAGLNNRLKLVQQLAQQALAKANSTTTNYISQTDPSANNTVSTGDIWTRVIDTEEGDS
ncbi:prophage endopeptidase tail family protein [Liquorilactobacillus mali]|uniref:prophage endopeptidase tail family protein n=1 Tax=Liquorilactobacillus mali TaxID=1618 RepID=UPI00264AA159|nr:prophage endopeptidase tail family protein [Liquorilactobacillus mali]MDN7145262.1 prophage endopeptidase tail family protein [Liquorilactobacillus mali]